MSQCVEKSQIIKELDAYVLTLDQMFTRFAYYGRKDFITENLEKIFNQYLRHYAQDCLESKKILLQMLKDIFKLLDKYNTELSPIALADFFNQMWTDALLTFSKQCMEEAQHSLFSTINENFAEHDRNLNIKYLAETSWENNINLLTDWHI
jgi:gamma-glutamylcysteine synthetase